MFEKILFVIWSNDFCIQLLAAYCLFAFSLKRRRHFVLRAVASVIGILCFSFFTPQFISFEYGVWAFTSYSLARYLFIFLLSLLAVKFCFDCSWAATLFCGIGAYATQHAFHRLTSIYNYVFFYWVSVPDFVQYILFWVVMILTYGASRLIFSRGIRLQSELEVNNARLLIVSSLLLMVMLVMSFLSQLYTLFNESLVDTPIYIILALFSVITCYFAMINLFDNANTKKMEYENKMLHTLWQRDRAQYQISKRNIELLNVKFHDLKYYLSSVLKDEALLQEVNESLRIYDSMFRTQNETLDVVLTEKNLYCNKIGIDIACIVDGECLNMMKPVDIYSLFGNAIDNAIECLTHVDDLEKKVINVIVQRTGKMVRIQIDNYIPNSLLIEDGLPQTTKPDKLNHGYGLKSIRFVAKKYKGSMDISVQDHVFSLIVLIPLS